MDKQMEALAQAMAPGRKTVFFGGAGVSTESGIPDFRSAGGIYGRQYAYPPEVMVSHSFFMAHPDEFYEFYRREMVWPRAKPNAAHIRLAELEAEGRVTAVVTQNIDGLHQMAGSQNVYELHGSVHRNTCQKCGARYTMEELLTLGEVPQCPKCGGRVKPDVVLYEEGLDNLTVSGALDAIRRADLLIVAGTSLTVYPAAAFLDEYPGNRLVLINKTETPRDDIANLALHEKLGEVFERL